MFIYFILFACNPSFSQRHNPSFIEGTSSPQINDTLMSPTVKSAAIQSYEYAVQNDITISTVMTIIDFQLPSTKKRLWVVDLESGKTLFHEQVTHGKNSDRDNNNYVDKNGFEQQK